MPQRDCVRSAMAPIIGSVITSNRRATSIKAAVSATVKPKMLVKNSGKAMDITFQVIPPAAASPRAYPNFSDSFAINYSFYSKSFKTSRHMRVLW